MIGRFITIILASFLICPFLRANEEHDVSLKRGDTQGVTIDLPYGNISFRLVEYSHYHRVLISIENTTTSQALLLFKHSQGEAELKKNKPKIEFEKTFPGSKGNRSVYGCKDLNQPLVVLIPQEKSDSFSISVSMSSPTRLELPVYLAKYNPKKLLKHGACKTDYKILNEDVLVFNIEIKGWSENDSDYLAVKGAVEKYLQSLQGLTFCKNKRHKPSLRQQQKPYREKRDSLMSVIKSTIDNHQEWFSTDAPHIAYTELYNRLEKINLNDYVSDCGNHRRTPSRPDKPRQSSQHSCGYCGLSAQGIYHQMDDLYQQLRAGKISRDAAVKKARALYSCYQNSSKREKSSFYGGKIAGFYSRIVR